MLRPPHIIGAALLYALLGVCVTWPLALHMGDSIVANGPGSVDGYLGIWNIWWTGEALAHGRSPFFSPLLFYPQGIDLFWQTLSLPNGLLALPLTRLLGPLPAYNALIIAGYALGGLFAMLFVRHCTGSAAAGLVGGAVFALAPFHLQKVVDAQLEVASVQWVPLCLLLIHRHHWRPSVSRTLLATIGLLLAGLGTWYYGLFCLIYAALLPSVDVALSLAARRSSPASAARSLAWGAAPCLLWLLAMAPALLSLGRSGDALLGDARIFNARSSADLVAFFLPNPLHPLWGPAVSDVYLRLHPDAFLWNVSLGLVGTILAVVGMTSGKEREARSEKQGARRKQSEGRMPPPAVIRGVGFSPPGGRAMPIVVLLGITLLLAMGEDLVIGGWRTGVPLPYALLADLPGIRSSHRPNHFVILSIALLAVLAGRGALALTARIEPRWRPAVYGLLIALILGIDGYAGPQPLVARAIPPGYAQLPQDGRALLPIPLNFGVSRSENIWYQTAHGRPIVGGFIGREPPYPLRNAPGVRELRTGRVEPDDIFADTWQRRAVETMASYGVGTIALHPDAMKQTYAPIRALVADLGLRPSYADARLELYPLPQPTGRPLVYLGDGWGGVERDGARRWRWMGSRAQLVLLNPAAQTRAVRLTLTMESYARDRELLLSLDGHAPISIAATRAQLRRTYCLLLPPGEHMVYLQAQTDPRPGDGRPISVSFAAIAIE